MKRPKIVTPWKKPAAAAAVKAAGPPRPAGASRFRFLVMYVPDGQPPRFVTYAEPKDVLTGLSRCRDERQDVVALCAYGEPLRLAVGDALWLALPGGESAMALGPTGEVVTRPLEDIAHLPLSETGQLGPDYLLQSAGPPEDIREPSAFDGPIGRDEFEEPPEEIEV